MTTTASDPNHLLCFSQEKLVMSTGERTGSAAAVVRERVLAGGERFWRHGDFGELPASAVATALSRLAREGELQRVGKGVYFRPRMTVLGPSMPSATGAAASSLTRPVHPAGLSAANVLGLSTQNPARREYATTANDPPTALAGDRVRTGRPAERAGLGPEDGALLELLRDRAATSDLSPAQTISRLRGLLGDRQRFSRLAVAAAAEPPRVRAMLGALGSSVESRSSITRAGRWARRSPASPGTSPRTGCAGVSIIRRFIEHSLLLGGRRVRSSTAP